MYSPGSVPGAARRVMDTAARALPFNATGVARLQILAKPRISGGSFMEFIFNEVAPGLWYTEVVTTRIPCCSIPRLLHHSRWL